MTPELKAVERTETTVELWNGNKGVVWRDADNQFCIMDASGYSIILSAKGEASLRSALLAGEREDDGALATPAWMEAIGLDDKSNFRNTRRYKIGVVHIVFHAAPGGWDDGFVEQTEMMPIYNNRVTRDDVRALAKVMGVTLTEGG